MITHELKIGQRIFDVCSNTWGEVLLIGGADKDRLLTDEDCDMIVLFRPDNSYGESETTADRAYPLFPNNTFKGHAVCVEIEADTFQNGCPYYCPDLLENCFNFELD